MQLRRLTRLTNGFSKRLRNLKAAVALHFAFYNFCRVHSAENTGFMSGEEAPMTQRAAKHLKDLCVTTEKYLAVVEKQLSKVAGNKPNEAFVLSAAKYYPALKKLADK